MSHTLTLHHDDEDATVCRFGPVIYIVWRSAQALAPVTAADAAIEEMAAQFGEDRRLYYVHRATDRPGFQRSDPAVRKAMMDHFRRHEERFLAAVVAIEAKGVWGGVIRSISSGVMLLLRRSGVRTEVFRDVRDGVRWLAEYGHETSPFDPQQLIDALTEADLCPHD
jgi:hypothetical protein